MRDYLYKQKSIKAIIRKNQYEFFGNVVIESLNISFPNFMVSGNSSGRFLGLGNLIIK